VQGCSGNSCYAAVVEEMAPGGGGGGSGVDLELVGWTAADQPPPPPPVVEFPPDSLRFVDKLGQGPHGEVRSTCHRVQLGK